MNFLEKKEQKLLQVLRTELLSYLKNRYILLKNNNKGSMIYDVLILEVIKLLGMMLKFGLFPVKFNDKYSQKNQFMSFFATKFEKTDIENFIEYLAFFLEYDDAYDETLTKMNIKKSNNFILLILFIFFNFYYVNYC